MKISRRRVLRLASGAACLSLVPGQTGASHYPDRTVQLTVGVTAGGSSDLLARLMADWLSHTLGQTFVVVNRPGAGTNIATVSVIKAPADGYSLLWAATANAINATLFRDMSFNFIQDTTPVAGVARVPLIMVVNPNFPAKTVPEFIDYAREHPKAVSMASPSIGTSNHMAGELFMMMAHVEMVHVPYRGSGPALADLLSGQVQVMFDTLPSSLPRVRNGSLRALAVTALTRLAALPEVPAMNDVLAGYDVRAWFGICAPRHTPADVVETLNLNVNAGLADPTIKQKFTELGANPFPGSAADFGKFIAAETQRWAEVVKFAVVKSRV